MHVKLRLPLHVSGARYTVYDALHVNSRGNHYLVSDNHRECRSEVYAIPGLCAPGIDGAAQLEQDLGAGWNGVGLRENSLRPYRCWRACRRRCSGLQCRRGRSQIRSGRRSGGGLAKRRPGGGSYPSQRNCGCQHSFAHTHSFLRGVS